MKSKRKSKKIKIRIVGRLLQARKSWSVEGC